MSSKVYLNSLIIQVFSIPRINLLLRVIVFMMLNEFYEVFSRSKIRSMSYIALCVHMWS